MEKSHVLLYSYNMAFPQRYLVRFHPKHTPHVFTDILVIGGGIAGLRSALSVPDDLRVLVVTKDKIAQSNSSYAQGGIAGVLSPEDRFENHVEDTIVAGAGLCDRSIVETVIREAPGQINNLVSIGTKFDLDEGHIALGKEGGHSHHRIVHALGDSTGHEVMRRLLIGFEKPRMLKFGRRLLPLILSRTKAVVLGRWYTGTAGVNFLSGPSRLFLRVVE